jgi:ribonuclease I
MSDTNNGGPAFPMAANEYAGHGPCWGMTLRDYFAAKAMQGVFTSPIASSEVEQDYIAMHAYRMADAMLRARGET